MVTKLLGKDALLKISLHMTEKLMDIRKNMYSINIVIIYEYSLHPLAKKKVF